MAYIVPRDKPTECHGCPFCDIYTYDCRLQRVQYETFDEQIHACPLIDGTIAVIGQREEEKYDKNSC